MWIPKKFKVFTHSTSSPCTWRTEGVDLLVALKSTAISLVVVVLRARLFQLAVRVLSKIKPTTVSYSS